MQKRRSLAHSRWFWIAYQTPESWDDKLNMKRQKDEDARWIRKHGKSYYGYKNHINIDKEHGFPTILTARLGEGAWGLVCLAYKINRRHRLV